MESYTISISRLGKHLQIAIKTDHFFFFFLLLFQTASFQSTVQKEMERKKIFTVLDRKSCLLYTIICQCILGTSMRCNGEQACLARSLMAVWWIWSSLGAPYLRPCAIYKLHLVNHYLWIWFYRTQTKSIKNDKSTVVKFVNSTFFFSWWQGAFGT